MLLFFCLQNLAKDLAEKEERFRTQIRDIKRLTDNPFGLNLVLGEIHKDQQPEVESHL